MSFLADNLKILRTQKGLSQQKLADGLLITRSRYVKYEDGRSEPPIELLIRLSKYYNLSIDLLVSVDISKYSPEEMVTVAENRLLLPVAVDAKGENKIEIIPEKASMGYLTGYNDPEYIETLQTLSLPFLKNGKFRCFPASGDSMPPFKDGTYIIGKFTESYRELKKNKSYLFITRNEGIVYKRFDGLEGDFIRVSADNNFYDPYNIHLGDLIEIWQYACSIIPKEFEITDFKDLNIKGMFREIKNDIKSLRKTIETR